MDKGKNAVLATQNQYSYCWNNPNVFADYDGKYPAYTAIREVVGNTITSLGEAVGNAVGEIGTAIGNATEEIYSTAGTTVQDICGTVGDPIPSGEVHAEMSYSLPVTKTFNIFDFLLDAMDVDNCIE